MTKKLIAWDDVASKIPDVVQADLDAITDAKIAAGAVPRWAPLTPYTAGQQVVSPNNDVVSRKVTGTSGASFVAGDWQLSSTYVGVAGNQTVAGLKNFTTAPTVNGAAIGVGGAVRQSELIPVPRKPVPQVVLTFDDGYMNDWTVVKPILDTAGVKGTFCLTTVAPGMGWANATALAAAGHELVAHSRNHTNLIGVSAATLTAEIDGSFADILANTGVKANGFCWPLNALDAAARTSAARQGTFAIGSGGVGDNRQPFNSYALARQQITNAGALATYTGWVDTAIANNATLIVLVHSGADLNATQQGYLASLITYCQSNNVPIRTMTQALAVAGNLLDAGDPVAGTAYTVIDGQGRLSASALATSAGLAPYFACVPWSVPPNASSAAATAAYQANSAFGGSVSVPWPTISVWAEWSVLVAAGTYKFAAWYTRSTNQGIVSLIVDGVTVGSFDAYGTFAVNQTYNLAGLVLTEGRHTVRFQMDSKNASSTGYSVTLQEFDLARTGA